jgi:hypothetical protein
LGIPIVLDNLLDFKYFTRAVVFEKGDENVLHRIKPLQYVYQFLNRHAIQLLSMPHLKSGFPRDGAVFSRLYSWRSARCIAADAPANLFRTIQKHDGEADAVEPVMSRWPAH